jgi:flagellar biosynthetic protein FliQ
MPTADIVSIWREAFIIMLIISGPILIISVVIGLIISILQTTTSIQEQTLTFVPKIIGVIGIIIFLFNWMQGILVEFTKRLFERIGTFF